MNNGPRTIAVDLTPVLPGGENGGAKVFVIELLRSMAAQSPHIRFVLLTQSASHAELASLDSPNLSRLCVLQRTATPVARSGRLHSLARKLLWLLPEPARARLASGVYVLRRRKRTRAATSLLAGIEADLLFCPFTSPTYAEAGVPVVSTLYDLQYRTYPEFFAPEDVAHRDAVFRAACRESACIAAISDYARESALRAGDLDASRIRTIHLRIARRFEPPKVASTVLEQHGLVPGGYLIYPANFWRHKNHEMLLAAFGVATRSGLPGEVKLVCTGAPGERSDFLQRAAAAFGLRERVLFPGYVASEDLAALMAGAVGMVFPSLYEGFGLPVLEAMAAGVPVACSNRTSLPEVAQDAALLFDPGVVEEIAGALVRIATDKVLRAKCIEAGHARATEYADTPRMAREYLDLFAEALAPHRATSEVSGVYEDGWLGPELKIFLDDTANGTLHLEFLAPDWLPRPKVRIKPGGRTASGLTVRRGRGASLTLPAHPGSAHIGIAPCFVPARTGHGADQRELTLMLTRCEMRKVDGSSELLWKAGDA